MVFFLDLDGVLNIIDGDNSTYLKQEEHFERNLVNKLNKVLSSFDINIVISSSWRDNMSDLLSELKRSGFKHEDKVIGHTPFLSHRGLEIHEYIYKNDIDKYLIIDDNIFEILEFFDMENILKVDCKKGLDINELLIRLSNR
jgi:hypothetical protein